MERDDRKLAGTMKKLIALFCLLPLLSFALPPEGYYVSHPWFFNWEGTNTSGSGSTNIISGLGVGIPTNSPNLFWTNNVYKAFWSTNANFVIGQVGLASSNFWTSSIMISNSGAGTITATLPYPCYSISAGTTVSAATVPGGDALDLSFYANTNGLTYVADKGANNLVLQGLASSVAGSNGVLTALNGQVNIITNLTVWSLSAQNQLLANYMATLNGSASGLVFAAADTLGTISAGFYDRTWTNGLSLSNPNANVVDVTFSDTTGAWSNHRWEHRTANLTNSANLSGELQFWLNGSLTEAWGTNSAFIATPLFTKTITASNITASAITTTSGFITNGNLIFCTTTNIYVNTNYIYVAVIGAGGFIYFTTNNGVTNVWLHR